MAGEPVLFLGGPWHGRHVDIETDAANHVVPNLNPIAVSFYRVEDNIIADHSRETIYTKTRPPGSTDVVFVASDYTYDTPEWLAYDVVDHPARYITEVRNWQHHGPWRWSADESERYGGRRFVLVDHINGSVISMKVDPTECDDPDMIEFAFGEMRRELEYRRLPLCAVPECHEKGEVLYVAAEHGRLAGRAWRNGDEIRLCHLHGSDVRQAQCAPSIDELPDWMVPDARVGPYDVFAARWDIGKGRLPVRVRGEFLALRDGNVRILGYSRPIDWNEVCW